MLSAACRSVPLTAAVARVVLVAVLATGSCVTRRGFAFAIWGKVGVYSFAGV